MGMSKTMKAVFILLAMLVAVSGLPAQAAVIPGCTGMSMPAPVDGAVGHGAAPSKHSCCGMGADCDCSIETRSTDILMDVSFTSGPRSETNGLEFRASEKTPPVESFKDHPNTEESPPQETPLYDLYSDYRI